MLTIVSFVVVLLVLIFVHELGHFVAAKLMGVKVERFSLGFPPKAFSKVIGETEYQLAWLPLGGYVKMYGEDPTSEEKVPPEMEKRSFSHQPAWAKIFIVVAGPIFNLIFAALLFWGLIWTVGIPHLPPTVGPVTPGSPAAQAGIQMDDIMVAINGQPMEYFDALDTALAEGQGAPLRITVSRQGLTPNQTFTLTPGQIEDEDIFGEPLLRWEVGLNPLIKPIIKRVLSGNVADEAGLEAGDLIVSINGTPTPDWHYVLEAIQGPSEDRASLSPKTVRPLLFEVDRQGQRLTLEVVPELTTGLTASGDTTYTPRVGMEVQVTTLTEDQGFFYSAWLGVREAVNMIELTLISVKKLVTGEVSAKALGGPILIAEVTGDRARAGWEPLLALAAFISINLGILNLLPIPVLDGGQLVFFIIEAIRRKPVSIRIREMAQWVGVVLLGLLMIVVFYNDIARLVTRANTVTEVEREAPQPEPPPEKLNQPQNQPPPPEEKP